MAVTQEETKRYDPSNCLACLSKGSSKPGVLIPPWKGLFTISIAYFCVYSAYGCLQELVPSLHYEHSLGYVSFAIVYGVTGISSFFVTATIQTMGFKFCFCWTFAMHIIYLCSNFFNIPAVLLAASVALGSAINISSTCVSLYLSGAAKSYIHAKELPHDKTHGVASMFNGIYFFFFRATHIIGNLITSLILSGSSYAMILQEDNVCGASVCSDYLTSSENSKGNSSSIVIVSPKKQTLNLLLFIFLAMEVAGFLIVFFIVPFFSMENLKNQLSSFGSAASGSTSESPSSQNNVTTELMESKEHSNRKINYFKADFLRSAKIFMDSRLLLLSPIYFAHNTIVFVMYTGYTKAFISCAIGMKWVGYSMLFFGVASACSSLIVNYLARYTGRIALMLSGSLIEMVSLISMLIWQPDQNTPVAALFILPSVIGLSIGVFKPQIVVLVASIFKENSTAAYAGISVIRSLAILTTQLIFSFACLYHQLILSLFFYVLGLICYLVLEYRHRLQSPHSLPLVDAEQKPSPEMMSEEKRPPYGSISGPVDKVND